MPITCNVCYAWHPAEWNGWKWIDAAAKCEIKNRFTTPKESCDSGSLIRPEGTNEKHSDKKAASVKVQEKNEKRVAEFTGEMFKHQKEAIEYFDKATEIALFFQQGLGKSATILKIAANKFKRKEINALLIIAPNMVHKQWYTQQMPLWLDVPYEAQCLYGRGGARKAYAFETDDEVLQVVCVNIDTFSQPSKWRDVVDWANSNKTFIVLDEATVIKNPASKRSEHVLYEFSKTYRKGKSVIASKPLSVARAILTGTPVTNGPLDLWSLMEFLRPNFFGRNWYAFKNRYGMYTSMLIEDSNGKERTINVPLTEKWWKSIKRFKSYEEAQAICGCSQETYMTVQNQECYEGPYKNIDELKELIKPVSMFKLLKDCIDMPSQNRIQKKIIMSDEQRKCYDEMVEEFITTYDTHTATALNKLSMIIRLQQISSGFLCDKTLIDENNEEENFDTIGTLWELAAEKADILPNEIKWIGASCPKLDMMYLDIETCAKPIIIVTRFTAEAARIYNDLSALYKCCLVTGWKRVGTIEEFQEGKYDIMVANIAAIARGLNLQNSSVIAIYSNTHSLELRDQLEGRIFRIGQTEPCEYIDYVNEDSIDEKVISSLILKRNLLDYVRSVDVKELVK
jgi:hypothetical protein